MLCRTGVRIPPKFQVFRTDGGTPEPLVLSPEIQPLVLIRWGDQGVQVLTIQVSGGFHYVLHELGSGTTRPFSSVAKSSESHTALVSWSSDGRKAAYWTSYCAQYSGFLGPCLINQFFLNALDVATGTETRVAVHTAQSCSCSALAMSPTGSMVAYTINGRLHLLEVSP